MGKFLLVLLSCAVPAVSWAHGISEADKAAMIDGGYLRYISLGASHMITGYDHLLFLFGVIFFLTNVKDIVKFITAFTLGHSITLIFATFKGISANYYLIDAVIALSVCYKGFDNNNWFKSYLGVKAPNMLLMVFVFGLIHGFGLSTRLQQLPLGDHGSTGMLLRIISFNVGVEVGQVVALSVMLILLQAWRKRESFKRFSRVSNDGLVLAGFLLFLMQMHGYQHTRYPEDFGFNEDAHYHWHLEKPRAVVCDNGTEFTGKAMDAWAFEKGVELQFIQPGKPIQNAFIESFNGKFRASCLQFNPRSADRNLVSFPSACAGQRFCGILC